MKDIVDSKLGRRKLRCGAVPLVKKICRACLALDVKMYHIKDKLGQMYQNITGILTCGINDKLSQYICWECKARLAAAESFRAKALLSDGLLNDLLKTDNPIKQSDIKSIYEKHSRLATSLVIHKVFDSITIDSRQTAHCKTEGIFTPDNDELETDLEYLDNRIDVEGSDGNKFEEYANLVHDPIKTEINLEQTDVEIETEDRKDDIFIELLRLRDDNEDVSSRQVSDEKIGNSKIKNIDNGEDLKSSLAYDSNNEVPMISDDGTDLKVYKVEHSDDDNVTGEVHTVKEKSVKKEKVACKTKVKIKKNNAGRAKKTSRLEESTRQQIIMMKIDGVPISDIANELGVTRNTVYLWWRRWRDEGNVNIHVPNGRPRVTTAEQDQCLVKLFNDEQSVHSPSVAADFGVSAQTVRRRLRQAGLQSKKKKPVFYPT